MTRLVNLLKFSRRAALRGFRTSRKGVAAIEFAFIAPIMIAFYFGMSEVTMGIAADRKVSHTSSVVGDLASQVSEIDGAGIADIMTAALAVIDVKAARVGDVTVEISSYELDPSDNTKIRRIGYALMGPPISAGGPATFDPYTLQKDDASRNMITKTSGAIVARVNFKYRPVTLKFMKNLTMHETFILKPRKSASVPFKDGTKSKFTCTAGTNKKASCRVSG